MARLLPLLVCGFALGVVLADVGWLDVSTSFWLGCGALLAGIRVAFLAWRVVCATALFTAAGGLALAVPLAESARWIDLRRADVTLEATVCRVARRPSWIAVELCDVSEVWDELAGRAEVGVPDRLMWGAGLASPEFRWLAERLPGDRIRARLRLRPLSQRRNPGERERGRALERRGLGGRAGLADPLLLVRLPQFDRGGADRALARVFGPLRARISHRLAAPEGGALLAALATGQRDDLTQPQRDAFNALGLGHLLAVSGLHLALTAGLAYGGIRLALVRVDALSAVRDIRPLALWIAFLCACVYALLAGWGIPVRRALVLLLALVAALSSGRVFSGVQALAAAGIVIAVVEPWAIFEAGAQLSFAASAALLMAAREATPAAQASDLADLADSVDLVDRADHEQAGAGAHRLATGWRGLTLSWKGVLRTTATAFLATAPIAVAHGGAASPFALAANALMVPWTALVLLPLALVSAAIAALPVSDVGTLALEQAARVAGSTLDAVLWVADALPRHAPVSAVAPWALMLGAALSLFALSRSSLASRAGLALALALWFRAAPTPQVEPRPPRVVALDVGLGDAVLVQGETAAVLVDAGWASNERADLGASVVVPALLALGVESLDLVVATHGDTDHQGGLRAVLRDLPVERLWLPPGGLLDPVFADLIAEAVGLRVAIEERSASDPEVAIGDLLVTPLWPPRSWQGSANDRSLVLRIELADTRVLLMGDLGGSAEQALLESAAELRSDLVKVGHHGSRTSASAEFLRAVDATVALVSAPCGRRSLPSGQTLDRLRAAGAAIWWTGRDGAVVVKLAPELAVWGWAKRPKSGCGE